MSNVIVHAVQCPNCLAIIFSRAHHDCHHCPCKEVYIDGGREYTRIGFGRKQPHPVTIKLVGLMPTELYADWNFGANKYGTIRTKKIAYNDLYRYTLNAKGKFYRYVK